MSVKLFMMPVDYTGKLPSNRVTGEIHQLGITANKLVVPFSGFFYTDNFLIWDANNKPLERGKDFQFVYANEEVQMRTPGLEVCGALIIKPHVVGGTCRINYSQVGGPYANYTRAIEQALLLLDLDNREIDFANMVGMPEYFTVGPHADDIGNVFGFEYLRLGLDRIRDTLMRSSATTSTEVAGMLGDLIDNVNLMFTAHSLDHTAHNTTANEVGAYSKSEVDLIKLALAQSIQNVESDLGSLNSGQDTTALEIASIRAEVGLLSRRMTVIDNIAKSAIRK